MKKASAKREAAFREKAAKTPCEFWQQGRCNQGDNCPYSHDGEGSSFAERLPCRFYKSGSCQRGDECIYSHDLKSEPCVFFHLKQHKGGCQKGDECPFSHEPMTDEQKEILKHEQE
ncbi:uncharacterized protein EV422DRAFT_498787, partial [Fimicolochytrium jonesii]|uniref:uncharacterized protein n=1 Tax=Fimicolochytrium jonesii TaxID=1396493 RepID=UPI0022FE3B43